MSISLQALGMNLKILFYLNKNAEYVENLENLKHVKI